MQPGAEWLDTKFRPSGLYDANSWIDCTQSNLAVRTPHCLATKGIGYDTSW